MYNKVAIIKATNFKKKNSTFFTLFKDIRSNKECTTHVYLIYVCRLMFDIVANAVFKNVYTEAKMLHSLNEILKKDDFRRICHASKLHVFPSYLN